MIKFETKCQSKSCINHLSAPLVKLFNFIISKGTFPDSWLTGMITPIFKSGNRSDPSNYRGICVTSCWGKLFCSILNTRLNVYFHDQNILHSSLIGFLRGYRTTYHIFILMRTLIDKHVNNENRGKLFCCFVDFLVQKPFDSVWYDGLLSKFIHNKIGWRFFGLLSDVYSKLKCVIRYGDKKTISFPLIEG